MFSETQIDEICNILFNADRRINYNFYAIFPSEFQKNAIQIIDAVYGSFRIYKIFIAQTNLGELSQMSLKLAKTYERSIIERKISNKIDKNSQIYSLISKDSSECKYGVIVSADEKIQPFNTSPENILNS